MSGSFGRFTHAVVRALPPTLGEGEGGSGGQEEEEEEGEGGGGWGEGGGSGARGPPLDAAKAQRQLGVLGGILRQRMGLQVLELPPAPGGVRAALLEELCVVQGGTALLTRPPAPARRRELGGLREALEELKLRVVTVTDEGAALDGGDVLFTGREFFVGISPWTNRRGAEAVADTFRDFAVSTVPVGGRGRLKGFCSMAAPDTIAIGCSDAARRAIRAMEQLSDHSYGRLSVPDDPAGNCLFARPGGAPGGVLVHRSPEEFPGSLQPFQKLPGVTLVPAAMSEAAKLGGGLSSCCLLLNPRPDP